MPRPSTRPCVTRYESSRSNLPKRNWPPFRSIICWWHKSRGLSAGQITVREHKLGQAQSKVVAIKTPFPVLSHINEALLNHRFWQRGRHHVVFRSQGGWAGGHAKRNLFAINLSRLDQEECNTKLANACSHSYKVRKHIRIVRPCRAHCSRALRAMNSISSHVYLKIPRVLNQSLYWVLSRAERFVPPSNLACCTRVLVEFRQWSSATGTRVTLEQASRWQCSSVRMSYPPAFWN
jgi:hypothetical protein